MVRRWHGLDEVPADWGRSVVTIGVFDGVHRGHQRIVGAAAEEARRRGLRSVVITFDPHPDEVVRPGTHPPLLATTKRRIELLEGLGTDAVVVVPFTLGLSKVPPDEFVQSVLVDRLHAAHVIVGEDFRFGHKAKGDLPLLQELGEKYDFTAEGMPLVANGDTISSTYIRERLGSQARSRPPRSRSAARTASRASSSAATSGAGRSASPPPTWKRCRTPRSPPTASTPAGWSATPTATPASAGPRRSPSAPTPPSRAATSGPSRRTRSTATTSTSTASTWASTSRTASATP